MSGIFGHLNISDSDRVFNTTVGQEVIWDAAQQYVARVNAEISAQMSMFVERTTDAFKYRYRLPGGGYLQRRNSDGSYQTVKAVGAWDIALPLRDVGAQVGGNDVDMAYMTVQELDNHISTVTIQNVNTVRFEMLYALFNSAEKTFVDDLHGSLLVEPLANGDAVVYPPKMGSSTEATDNHYLEAGYVYTAIDATHNPIPTMKEELEEHFGVAVGGSEIIVFVPPVVTPYLRALGATHWTEVGDPRINYGTGTNLAQMLGGTYPGTLVGRCDGCWIVEWRWLPTDAVPYLLGIHPGQPRPLLRRVDPADTGLGTDLQLIARYNKAEGESFPFQGAFWRHRFGFGVGNRLNGVIMELASGGSYTVPTAYA